MTIVLCSKGYPRKYKKDLEIKNLDKIALPKIILFIMQEQREKIIKFCLQGVEF